MCNTTCILAIHLATTTQLAQYFLQHSLHFLQPALTVNLSCAICLAVFSHRTNGEFCGWYGGLWATRRDSETHYIFNPLFFYLTDFTGCDIITVRFFGIRGIPYNRHYPNLFYWQVSTDMRQYRHKGVRKCLKFKDYKKTIIGWRFKFVRLKCQRYRGLVSFLGSTGLEF